MSSYRDGSISYVRKDHGGVLEPIDMGSNYPRVRVVRVTNAHASGTISDDTVPCKLHGGVTTVVGDSFGTLTVDGSGTGVTPTTATSFEFSEGGIYNVEIIQPLTITDVWAVGDTLAIITSVTSNGIPEVLADIQSNLANAFGAAGGNATNCSVSRVISVSAGDVISFELLAGTAGTGTVTIGIGGGLTITRIG